MIDNDSISQPRDVLSVLKACASLGFMASGTLDDAEHCDALQTLFAHMQELLDALGRSLP